MNMLFYTLFFLSIPFLSIIPPLLWFSPREKREDAIGQGIRAGIIAMIATLVIGLTLFLIGLLALIPLVGCLTHRAAKIAGAEERCFHAALTAMSMYVLFIIILVCTFTW
ncbi:MAG: hypothetical protein IKV82_00600 [Akkermansia sp.]|nr:hypothetical protein [Akkermansia sp.]